MKRRRREYEAASTRSSIGREPDDHQFVSASDETVSVALIEVKHAYGHAQFLGAVTPTAEPENMSEMAEEKPGKGSLSEPRAKKVRELLQALLEKKYNNNKAAFGRDLKTRGQSISQLIKGINRPGWDTVEGLHTYLGLTWDEILEVGAAAAVRLVSPGAPAPAGGAVATTQGVSHMAELLRLRDLPNARYPRLEFALGFYAHEPNRWSPLTISCARQGQFEPNGCADWTPPDWVAALDRLEAVVRQQTAPALAPNPPPTPTLPPHRPSTNKRS